MRRTILAALPLSLLVLAAPAAAKDGRHHTTYRATLAPVAAEEPTASPSRRGHVEESEEVRGKAVLRDGRRRDRVKVRVRGLEPGVGYTWEVRQGGCAGEAVDGFRYRALKVRRHGGAKGRGVSRSFEAAEGASYALVVSGPGGDVACGEFQRKGARGGDERGDKPGDEAPGCDDPYGEDDTYGEDDEHGEDGPLAKSATGDHPDESCDEDSVEDESADDDGEYDDEPAEDDDEPAEDDESEDG